ncbi:hypothetical protein ACLOJK_035639 [Asimina triloba]
MDVEGVTGGIDTDVDSNCVCASWYWRTLTWVGLVGLRWMTHHGWENMSVFYRFFLPYSWERKL